MVLIRKETVEDHLMIAEINHLAFKEDKPARLIDAIRSSEYFVPDLSLVATTNQGKVIGHILFSQVFIETEFDTVQTISLAPMAVLPDYQNQGVGSLLVKEGLMKCKELGYQHVVVLGHPNFYPKFGFVPSKEFGIQPPFPVSDHVFMACELVKHSLANINGKVKYPEAFDIVS